MISDKPEILLVEDDLELREALTEALAIHGLPVATAGSGLEFYQLLKHRLFAVALIDFGLPDLDGFDLVAYLRQNTSVKIIIITSRDDLEARVKGYQSGADLYLTKPVKIPELAAAIVSLACRRSPEDTGPQPWRLDRITWRLFSPQGASSA
jgi:DNA-binding response OmpR family regulator